MADLQKYQPDREHNIDSFFMCALWLPLYDVEEMMAGRWGFGEKYCRDTNWDCAGQISALKLFKITMQGLVHIANFYLLIDYIFAWRK